MPEDTRIDYIEFPGRELEGVKDFYRAAFGWKFTDYGPDYTSFEDGRLSGGFAKDAAIPSALVVIYAADLERALQRVRAAGATITREIFSFPGGRRFHFRDPAGNELAVWSEAEPHP